MNKAVPNSQLIRTLLNLSDDVPLACEEMARTLRVTFFPPHEDSERLKAFSIILESTLRQLGVQVIPFQEAVVPGTERVLPGIIIIEQGEARDGELAIHHVSDLYQNPLVGIFEGPPPVQPDEPLQSTLDAIVSILAWNMTHIPIFVEESQWTICTMNGAVIPCGNWCNMQQDVLQALIPKLAAQVVPPKNTEISYRNGAFNTSEYREHINDFVDSGRVWRENTLMLAHTSVDALTYRNRFYKRIVAAYLDKRTGMSYGFLARQLPIEIKPARRLSDVKRDLIRTNGHEQAIYELDGEPWAPVECLGETWMVHIPDVWVLTTRSGCEKTNINPDTDIIRMGLSQGNIIVDTPDTVKDVEGRPSYDTRVILAHAMGNALVASILLAVSKEALFPNILKTKGLSISHWHGYPLNGTVPTGFSIHGLKNPPVSCSSPQSAVYAFSGKFAALDRYSGIYRDYMGDVHVEPHHGTNITGCLSLLDTASWVDRYHSGRQTILSDCLS